MRYIKGFDGLRGISVILVLLNHLWLPQAFSEDAFLRRNYFLISGTAGVTIFFALSGFLITLLLLREKIRDGRINFRRFFIRRFLRLFPPLIIFFLLVSFLMLFNLLPRNFTALVISFFYLYNFIPRHYFVWELVHTWSLGVEEQFYLLWPFLISKAKKISNYIIITIVVMMFCLAWIIIYPQLKISVYGKEVLLNQYFFVDRWFLPACLPIMTGALGGILVNFRSSELLKLFYRNYVWLMIAASIYFIPVLINNSIVFNLNSLFQSVGVALFLAWIYYNQESLIVKILEFKPLRFIGLISYGIYVYQGLFLRTGPGGHLVIQKFPLNIILTIILAIFSYYLIEKRVNKYKNNLKL